MLSVGSLFSGIGLLDYGLHLAGLRHAWLCESDPWRRGILAQRWPGATVLDDVRAVGAGTAERVDVIAGGFPCKGASTAGKRNGFGHSETVLWREMARAVGELRPRYVLVENVANILALHDGAIWGEVLGDLAALGYDTTWDCLPAAAVGAPHLRDRVFAIATHPDGANPGRDQGQRELENRRPDALGNAAGAASDTKRNLVREQSEPERGGGCQALVGRRPSPSANADGTRANAGAQAGRSWSTASQRAAAAQDTNGRTAQPAGGEWRGEPQGTPLAVDWGDYGPAIRRWERTLGRGAGEPLLQGVVARPARRVVRSRLSALGDGVQVQVGYLVGVHIMNLEASNVA